MRQHMRYRLCAGMLLSSTLLAPPLSAQVAAPPPPPPPTAPANPARPLPANPVPPMRRNPVPPMQDTPTPGMAGNPTPGMAGNPVGAPPLAATGAQAAVERPSFTAISAGQPYVLSGSPRSPAWLQASFARCDSNHDGRLSALEYAHCSP